MPIIPVDTNGNWSTLPSVISSMLFPEDEQKRNECACTLAWHRKLEDLGDGEEIVLLKQDAETLLAAPSLTEVLKAMSKEAAIAQIAGELLLLALQIDATIGGGSVRKARFLVGLRNSLVNETTEKRLWASDASLKKAWKKFRAVAHLWAALKIIFEKNSTEQNKLDETLCVSDIMDGLSDISMQHFASTSVSILEQGAKLVPRHQTRNRLPLLDLDRTWTFPTPFAADTRYSAMPDLPAWAASLCKEYEWGRLTLT